MKHRCSRSLQVKFPRSLQLSVQALLWAAFSLVGAGLRGQDFNYVFRQSGPDTVVMESAQIAVVSPYVQIVQSPQAALWKVELRGPSNTIAMDDSRTLVVPGSLFTAPPAGVNLVNGVPVFVPSYPYFGKSFAGVDALPRAVPDGE